MAHEGGEILAWSSLLFLLVYGMAYWALLRRGWGKKQRYEGASCFMSLLHGSAATALAAWNIFLDAGDGDGGQTKPPFFLSLAMRNTTFQNAVMEFSTAYFIVDLFHFAFFLPDEHLFILHHLATTTYMLSCRFYTRHGASSAVALLGLAESTSFLQNLWTLASLAPSPSTFRLLNPIFIPVFTFVRGFLAPLLTWYLCAFYFSGAADHVIPRWLVFYWMSTVVLAISGSIFWVSLLWRKLFQRSDGSVKPHKSD